MRFHRAKGRTVLACAVLLWGIGCALSEPVAAACNVESSADKTGSLKRTLAPDCTAAEREAQAVESGVVMNALAKGWAVELTGVVIRGDLILDRLPVQMIRTPGNLTPDQREALSRLNAEEIRSVSAPVTIRDAVVQGTIRHRSAKGTLQFEGPVDLHGTRFMQGVDLSRSLFQRAVDLSAARFEQESYWVQGQFGEMLNCADTKFGPHTRFHRSTFRGVVECTGALFDGMAEFLETTFEQRASFANTRFGLGTGFSGSRFMRSVSFVDAIFSREVFFGFAQFESEASFAGARFLGAADFSNAVFARPDDLSKAHFDRPPGFAHAKRTGPESAPGGGTSPGVQYIFTLGLLIAAALLVAYAYKIK